jgi:hypothetical protein
MGVPESGPPTTAPTDPMRSDRTDSREPPPGSAPPKPGADDAVDSKLLPMAAVAADRCWCARRGRYGT